MKPRLIILIIAIFSTKLLTAQNAEKHIERLVGKQDVEWLKNLEKELPTHQLNFTNREVSGFHQTHKNSRNQGLLNAPWYFFKNQDNGKRTSSETITIPHAFEKERAYHSAWYCSKYNIKTSKKERYFLMLSRIDLLSSVYINGNFVGAHIGAYTPFEFDVTDYLVGGDNVIAIFVYDKSGAVEGTKLITQVGPNYMQANEQRFKFPGGIDDVPILETRANQYVSDVFIKTSTRLNEIEIEFELNESTPSKGKISFEVFKWPNGEKVDVGFPEVNKNDILEGINTIKTKWANAELWSPDHPNLYVLRSTFKSDAGTDVLETRFGFREFWTAGKTFMLNGVPTKLRGESHYHLFRQGIDFHREVFKMHKELFGSNACRVHAFMPHPDIFMGADEAGVLIINQSAVWSVNGQLYAKGGDALITNLEHEYKAWVKRDRNNPSVVIWDIENEMLRFDFDLHLPWISKLPDFVKKYDATRPINLSGAGWFNPNQDMVSLHMQDNYARIMNDWKEKDNRPLITGEFWVGARADQRLPSAPEITSVEDRYLEEAATYERNILEMRYIGISGFMPFRISILGLKQKPHSTEGYNFTPPNTLVKAKRSQAVLAKIKHALQPVSAFFWPRDAYCDAHKNFQRELVICNDSETKDQFEVEWKWEGSTSSKEIIELAPGEQRKLKINETPPKSIKSITALVKKGDNIISADTIAIHPIVSKKALSKSTIWVFQDEILAKKLTDAGYLALAKASVPTANDKVLWVIPEHADNRQLEAAKSEILKFLDDGGNILCLKQEQVPTWFPVRFQFWSANLVHLHTYAAMGWEGLNKDLRYAKFATILDAEHPVFDGITNTSLHLWNTFDGRVADDAYERPSGLDKYESGNWRPLAASAKNTQISLAEILYGKGSLLACQLHVMDNLENPQAKRLFDNMINYLSEKKKVEINGHVLISGTRTANEIASLTNASPKHLLGDKTTSVMLAFDGANKETIKQHAANGGTVVVLSTELSKGFNDVSIGASKDNVTYVGTKVSNHPLLSGISSGNFKTSLSQGYFTQIPSNAKVLLQGFESTLGLWSIEKAGPIMISIPYQKGEIILSTLHIDKHAHNGLKEFLRQVLTNCNVPIAYTAFSSETTVIKKTVPIAIDGKLNEWLDDMDDRLVSPYVHAQPIYLTSKETIEGPSAYDLKLSGINYFLWNNEALYVSGVIFGEEKSPTSFIKYGEEKTYSQQVFFNDDVLDIQFERGQLSVKVNGQSSSDVGIKNGQLDSKYMTDATKLQFSYIDGGGEITTVPNLIGETFEMMIPWQQLNSKPNKEENKVLIHLSSKGSKLQAPLAGNTAIKNTWMDFNFNFLDK